MITNLYEHLLVENIGIRVLGEKEGQTKANGLRKELTDLDGLDWVDGFPNETHLWSIFTSNCSEP